MKASLMFVGVVLVLGLAYGEANAEEVNLEASASEEPLYALEVGVAGGGNRVQPPNAGIFQGSGGGYFIGGRHYLTDYFSWSVRATLLDSSDRGDGFLNTEGSYHIRGFGAQAGARLSAPWMFSPHAGIYTGFEQATLDWRAGELNPDDQDWFIGDYRGATDEVERGFIGAEAGFEVRFSHVLIGASLRLEQNVFEDVVRTQELGDAEAVESGSAGGVDLYFALRF